jgi:hypothetical protein
LEFALSPSRIGGGKQELTIRVKNTGDAILRNMNLRMHSLDENLTVECNERFVYALLPGQETIMDFPVSAHSDAKVYFSLSGFKNGDVFFRARSVHFQVFIRESISSRNCFGS